VTTVRVLLFAWLAQDGSGAQEVVVEVQDGASIADALEAVQTSTGWRAEKSEFAVACNEQYSDVSRVVADGDVIALIPPVGGG
jgi:molybdopterin synthase catalytic subunit